MTDYLIFGIIMLILVIAGVLIMKQHAKKKPGKRYSISEVFWELLSGMFEFIDF